MSIHGVSADSSRRRSAAAQVASKRSAESRRCPSCGRGSAIMRDGLPADVRSACRWTLEGKCDYVVMRES